MLCTFQKPQEQVEFHRSLCDSPMVMLLNPPKQGHSSQTLIFVQQCILPNLKAGVCCLLINGTFWKPVELKCFFFLYINPRKSMFFWYIYRLPVVHAVDFDGIHVGKYTITMDPIGRLILVIPKKFKGCPLKYVTKATLKWKGSSKDMIMEPGCETNLWWKPFLPWAQGCVDGIKVGRIPLHPGRLTWNRIIGVWKIIFLSKWVICRFHVNLAGCNISHSSSFLLCDFWLL